jgi:membrane associated rhomboid family serine protease
MIFPLLKGFLHPFKVPATYFIIFLNFIIFIFCLKAFEHSQNEIEKILSDHQLLQTQGLIFSQYVEARPQLFNKLLLKLADLALSGDHRSAQQMGGLAIRNSDFMREGLEFKPNGNDIAIESWRFKFKNLLELQKDHPSYYLGINYNHKSWMNWLTYQFAHSGFSHLFWNMLFLGLLGCFVESEIGTLSFVILYFTSGLFGAYVFANLSGISALPLVGASAAISGLVGCAMAMSWNVKADFFFWLLPIQNYFGLTKLPIWILLVLFCLPDLAGLFSSVSELGSIAYSAHLGGAVWGALVGFGLKLSQKFRFPKAV